MSNLCFVLRNNKIKNGCCIYGKIEDKSDKEEHWKRKDLYDDKENPRTVQDTTNLSLVARNCSTDRNEMQTIVLRKEGIIVQFVRKCLSLDEMRKGYLLPGL